MGRKGEPGNATAAPPVPHADAEQTGGWAGLASFWSANATAWSFIAFFGLIARIAAFNDATLAVVLTLVLDPIGFVLTTLAYKLYLERKREPRWVVFSWAVICSLAGGVLQMLVANAVKRGVFPAIPSGNIAANDAVPAVFYAAVFFGWSLAYLWIRADIDARTARLQHSEAQAAAIRAELQQLRLQLDPHFLFNALNTVASEIPDNPRAALEMTHRIASYLRYSLNEQTRPLCALRDEIEAVSSFMRIQELRFGSRLRCLVEIEPGVQEVSVPHLVVQGLVENAVKHGLRSPAATLDIRVAARRLQDASVLIEVTNPGRLQRHAGDRPAVGLANTKRRLELHYPLRHEFTLVQDGELVAARLLLKGDACFA